MSAARMRRRTAILAALAMGERSAHAGAAAGSVARGRALQFPRDHGAHLAARTEWWYLTGWRGPLQAPTHGFQITFFRHRTGLAADSRSRFAPRQLLFAHAALTDLRAGTHRHAQRLARWSGDPEAPLAAAARDDARVHIGRWRLAHAQGRWTLQADDAAQGLQLALSLQSTQPLLLQGEDGWSRKGPDPQQASHYVSAPQLALLDGAGGGRGWLDHEWSDTLMHPDAVGWDWAGINLADGAVLTVFQLRRRDGSVLWAGGSWRSAGGRTRSFAPHEVGMHAGEPWTSGATGARYPLHWTLRTPAGRHELQALLADQELDARASSGNVYWEGLSELRDAGGRRVGLGYLELTGYAGRLRL